jgi:glutaminyl-tRNA synthetase
VETKPLNFIEQIVDSDIANGFSKKNLRFRFPPEPNGYLHIGHIKALAISFGLASKYNAPVNLRFDDTNPSNEDQRFVDAIKKDIKWMGYIWQNETYSSDCFDQLYLWSIELIINGKAYIDSQSSKDIASQKGTPTTTGANSPFRSRSIEESLELFEKMKSGKCNEGEHVLRAMINMGSPNMLLRDPIIYRVINKPHQRTGNKWCVYPMYDWAHGQCDYIEQVSHSLCSLEFKPHRDLYEWFLEAVKIQESTKTLVTLPKQREFSRLNLSYTIMSKRKLFALVENNHVSGWDDPRMPTISGLRRRGYTPNSIKNFISKVGVAKRDNIIDVSLLEFCIREDLNKITKRAMAVVNPVLLQIVNYPAGKEEFFTCVDNPEEENPTTRKVSFSSEVYIEQEDFSLYPSSDFKRLSIGSEVRLKSGYIVKATHVDTTEGGVVTKIFCDYDPKSLSGSGSLESQRKANTTIHWVAKKMAIKAEVREYDRLFTSASPDSDPNTPFESFINKGSLKIREAFVEPSLKSALPGDKFQFQRLGYFNTDDDSTKELLIFNKTVSLREVKIKKIKAQQPSAQQATKKPPIEAIKKFGQKYMKLSEEKQADARKAILELSKEINYTDVAPLFSTSIKKRGTRAVALICLSQMKLKLGSFPVEANNFIEIALNDENTILQDLANSLV